MSEVGAGAYVEDNAPQPISETVSRGRLIFILSSVILGMLLSALDQTIVGTAMPRVIADLNGLEHYAWVFTAYMLASTVTVPIYGKLSDIYGRRPFFIGGMLIFLLGSALSGLAESMTQLIIFRAIQGLGAGAMMPIAIAIIGDIFPPAERAKWQGLIMAVFGLATVVGPALGGWLTDNFGWPWVFYVNMPVGAVAVVAAYFALPRTFVESRHKIDYWGAATLVLGTVPLLLAFSWAGSQYDWGSAQIVGLLSLAVVMLGSFVAIELRVPEPIINPSLFKNRIFTISVIASFLTAMGMFGATMYLPLFLQGVAGESAAGSGAAMTPMMLGFIVSSIIGGQIVARTGRYRVVALVGFAVGALGMFLLSRMTSSASSAEVVRNMLIVGLGIGVSMSLFTIIVQNAFPQRMLGQVTAGLQFFRSIGGTIGIAILGTVMTTRFQSAFDANVSSELTQSLSPAQVEQLRNPQALLQPEATSGIQDMLAGLGGNTQQLYDQLLGIIRDSLTVAITDLFLVGAAAMLLAFLAVIFLPEIPLKKGMREEQPAAEPATAQPAGLLDMAPGATFTGGSASAGDV